MKNLCPGGWPGSTANSAGIFRPRHCSEHPATSRLSPCSATRIGLRRTGMSATTTTGSIFAQDAAAPHRAPMGPVKPEVQSYYHKQAIIVQCLSGSSPKSGISSGKRRRSVRARIHPGARRAGRLDGPFPGHRPFLQKNPATGICQRTWNSAEQLLTRTLDRRRSEPHGGFG